MFCWSWHRWREMINSWRHDQVTKSEKSAPEPRSSEPPIQRPSTTQDQLRLHLHVSLTMKSCSRINVQDVSWHWQAVPKLTLTPSARCQYRAHLGIPNAAWLLKFAKGVSEQEHQELEAEAQKWCQDSETLSWHCRWQISYPKGGTAQLHWQHHF